MQQGPPGNHSGSSHQLLWRHSASAWGKNQAADRPLLGQQPEVFSCNRLIIMLRRTQHDDMQWAEQPLEELIGDDAPDVRPERHHCLCYAPPDSLATRIRQRRTSPSGWALLPPAGWRGLSRGNSHGLLFPLTSWPCGAPGRAQRRLKRCSRREARVILLTFS